MLFTSNPFDRMLPAAADGRDLNPLLQDPGMVIHPPMLYMGYVGFSVAFAFAIARTAGVADSMQPGLAGRGRGRRWPWIFMTIGIALGSWWAYYELGWGGLVVLGSGRERLVHALAGRNRADPLAGGHRRSVAASKSWTVLLAIAGVFAVAARDLPGALRRADLGACLRHRPRARSLHSRAAGDRHRRFACTVRLACSEGGARWKFLAALARERCCCPTTCC